MIDPLQKQAYGERKKQKSKMNSCSHKMPYSIYIYSIPSIYYQVVAGRYS